MIFKNLIFDFNNKNFKLYNNEKLEKIICLKEIINLQGCINIRNLKAFGELFKKEFFKNNYINIWKDDVLEPLTFKIIENEFEIFMFEWMDKEKKVNKILNFDTQFLKVKPCEDIKFILEYEREAYNLGFSGITCSGASRNYWKKNFGGYKMINSFYNTIDFDFEMYDMAKKSLKGGLNILNENKKNINLFDTITIDLTSAYPWLALTECLPYGKPEIEYLFGEKSDEKKYFKYKLKLLKVKIFEMKIKENKVAWFFTKGRGGQNIYHDYLENEIIVIWHEEFERLKEDYYIDYDIITIHHYKCRKGSFEKYLNFLNEKKEKSEKGTIKRDLIKSYMNGFLGTFATKPEQSETIYDSNGIKKRRVIERTDYYLPLFSYLTSKLREYMAFVINDIITCDFFIRTHTDSISIDSNCESYKVLDFDNFKIGYFKIESINCFSYYKDVNNFVKIDDLGKIEYVICGINTENIKIDIKDYINGSSIKQRRLFEPDFIINDFPYYKEIEIKLN